MAEAHEAVHQDVMQNELRTVIFPQMQQYLKGKQFVSVVARRVPDDYFLGENPLPETTHEKRILKRMKVSLIRHGQGFHNVAQKEWRNDPKWDRKSEPYTVDNDPNYRFMDAMLTSIGENQACELQPRVDAMLAVTQRHLSTQLPFLLIVSPMRRAIETGLIAFNLMEIPNEQIRNQQPMEIVPVRPSQTAEKYPVLCKALEWCHERAARHTCDKRLMRSQLEEIFCSEKKLVDFSGLSSEEDPFWHETERESLYKLAIRCAEFVDVLFSIKDDEYSGVAVACHSTFLFCLHNAIFSAWENEAAAGSDQVNEWYQTGEMRTVELTFMKHE